MSDTERFLRDLDAALTRAGVRGTRRRRIVAEFADHLSCDPHARLGEPVVLANQFADELATGLARTAALHAFGALAFAGVLILARTLAALPIDVGGFGTADTLALLIATMAAQVALVAGALGLLRALRLRHSSTIPRQEATVLLRRAGLGLAAGAVTIFTAQISHSAQRSSRGLPAAVPPSSLWLSLSSAAALTALVLATPALARAARLRPTQTGQAGDLLVDLGPLQKIAARVGCDSVNRIAYALAAGLVVVLTVAGVAADDPFDGMLRGALEGGAFLSGYAVLGGYLGIRRPPSDAPAIAT